MREQRTSFSLLLWLFLIVAIPGVHIGTALLSAEGPARIERVLHQEYAYLQLEDNQDAQDFLDRAVQRGYRIAWEGAGIREASQDPGPMGRALSAAWPAVEAWILTAELLALRLGVIMLALPFWLLVLLLAGLDGLVGWYIRRTVAGRESAFIYHRTKKAFVQTGWGGLILYLAIPFALDPLWIFPAWYLLSALLLRFTVAYFKKYL